MKNLISLFGVDFYEYEYEYTKPGNQKLKQKYLRTSSSNLEWLLYDL